VEAESGGRQEVMQVEATAENGLNKTMKRVTTRIDLRWELGKFLSSRSAASPMLYLAAARSMAVFSERASTEGRALDVVETAQVLTNKERSDGLEIYASSRMILRRS